MGDMLLTQFLILQKKFDEFSIDIASRQANIETTLKEWREELKGTTQPGRCMVHETRLNTLESWRSWMSGAVWGMGAIAGVCGAGVLWILQRLADKIKW